MGGPKISAGRRMETVKCGLFSSMNFQTALSASFLPTQ